MMESIFITRSSMPDYDEYIEAIKPLWESHWLTNMGIYHKELEQRLTDFLGVSGLSLMVNGHMSLELAIQSFGFPEGGEVITTPFTFISTTHAIVRNGLKPVFCDVKETDGTIDETKIEELITPNTVAIVPVHVYGNVCDVESIQDIADKYNLKVIYDAAHAFGESYKGKGVGSYGDASIFSFHATKVFNTIEGGAVAFSDVKMKERLFDLKNFGIHGEELVTAVGANAKMNEFCAIMGLCNLKHFDRALSSRKKVYEYYTEMLGNIKGIRLFLHSENQTINYAYYPILVDGNDSNERDQIYEEMHKNGIYPRKYFYPLTSDQVCFKNKYKSVEIKTARKLSNQVLALPIYEGLSIDSAEKIVKIIQNITTSTCSY